jgi:nicotinate phosphoribosyltransferase
MEQGTVVQPPESLKVIAERSAQSVGSLPPDVRKLQQPSHYPVNISQNLKALTESTSRRLKPWLSP